MTGGGLFHLVDEKQVRKRLVVMRVGAVGVVVVLGGFPLGLAGLVSPAPQVAGQGRFLATFDLQALLLPLVVGVEQAADNAGADLGHGVQLFAGLFVRHGDGCGQLCQVFRACVGGGQGVQLFGGERGRHGVADNGSVSHDIASWYILHDRPGGVRGGGSGPLFRVRSAGVSRVCVCVSRLPFALGR